MASPSSRASRHPEAGAPRAGLTLLGFSTAPGFAARALPGTIWPFAAPCTWATMSSPNLSTMAPNCSTEPASIG
jgi:hypothetical protein